MPTLQKASTPQQQAAKAEDAPENEEVRTVGVVALAGDNILLQNAGLADIYEVTMQPLTAMAIQLKEGGAPISGNFTLGTNQFWSHPGKLIRQNLVLTLSKAGNVNFEIRWAKATS